MAGLTLSKHSIMAMLFPLTTTMPISFLVDGLTCSTLWSSTMFMNWSYPLRTPLIVLLALSLTAGRRGVSRGSCGGDDAVRECACAGPRLDEHRQTPLHSMTHRRTLARTTGCAPSEIIAIRHTISGAGNPDASQ